MVSMVSMMSMMSIVVMMAGITSSISVAEPSVPRVLRIGTSGDYPPFSEAFGHAPGFRGFDVAVAEAFADERGYEIEWVQFAWTRLAEAFRAGRFDLAMSGVTVRPDRSALGRFSVPVLTSGAVLLFLRDRFEPGPSVRARDFESKLATLDIPGKKIGVNRGGHLERVARATFRRASVRSIPDNAAVRSALAEGSVDAVVTDTLEAPLWKAGLEGVSEFGPLTRDRKAYWVAPGREDLSRELDAWLLDRERDGTLARLRREYFGNESTGATAQPRRALLAAVDERLALMSWVAETKRLGGKPVEDAAQEVRVLDAAVRGVREAAERAGVAPPGEVAVRAFYRAQIEAAKAIQRRTLRGAVTQDVKPSDLGEVLRPALMRIGDRMAQLIVILHSGVEGADGEIDIEQELARHQLEQARLEEIRRSLLAIAK